MSADFLSTGFLVALAIIVLLELNAIFGKTGPMTTVKGVIHASLALTAVIFGVLYYV